MFISGICVYSPRATSLVNKSPRGLKITYTFILRIKRAFFILFKILGGGGGHVPLVGTPLFSILLWLTLDDFTGHGGNARS